jgi:hypothetical protein
MLLQLLAGICNNAMLAIWVDLGQDSIKAHRFFMVSQAGIDKLKHKAFFFWGNQQLAHCTNKSEVLGRLLRHLLAIFLLSMITHFC